MGLVLIRQGKLAEGEPYWREALTISRRVLGPAHPDTLVYAHNLASLALDQNNPAEAERLFREIIQSGGPAIGFDHPTVRRAATRRLGALLLDQKKYPETIDLLSKAEPAARKIYTGPNERLLGALLRDLGAARARSDQFAAAEASLTEAYAIFMKTRGEAHADTHASAQALADLYAAWEKAQPGTGHDVNAAEWRTKAEAAKTPGQDAPANVKK